METRVLEYIVSLHATSTGTDLEDKWYCIASCAFAASNQGKFVADVALQAISGRPDDKEYQKRVLRRIKESILRTTMLYGIPRTVTVLLSLKNSFPLHELNETSTARTHLDNPFDCNERGKAYMRKIYVDDMDPILAMFDNHWPELHTLIGTYMYGYYLADTSILDDVTTSQVVIASILPLDAPKQVGAHMRGLIRNGGTTEQLLASREISLAVCEICEVAIKASIPEVEEAIQQSRFY